MLGSGWQALAPTVAGALAAGVREAVLDGRVPPGGRLPAERRLAAQLGVSRGTVIAAYASLRADGWLTTRHGSGSTVEIPQALRLRYAPLSIDQPGTLLDLRRAVPAAPESYPAALAAALDRATPILLGDGDPGAGLPELRELIADRYTREGLPTRPGQILVTAGARAAISLLVAHLRPATAVVERPTYDGILGLLRQSSPRIVLVAVSPQGWDTDQLARAFQRARGGAAVLVPDFHNPTAASMNTATRKMVAALARSNGVTVVASEVMRDIDLRAVPKPLPRIPGAVVVGSMSKTVWTGLCVGWIRAPENLVRQLRMHPLCAVCAPPPLAQLVACELFPRLDALIAQRVAELRRQRDYLAEALGDDDALTFTVPAGGLWLWLRLARPAGDDVAARLAAVGLALLPGSHFSPDAALRNRLRFPFTAPIPTLAQAATLLRETLSTMSKSSFRAAV
jgi:Transcriptional regulators containing a DNA-binding HTH domain and an aminotransferase domain (MocR family) and their eukaryotic orthologs